jgi:DNA invertase Pin-like site-specific DNA recombinase
LEVILLANKRLPVRAKYSELYPRAQDQEVLRLKYDCGISDREIARSCGIARSTVADYLMKAKAAGLGWPEAAALPDAQIEGRLFPVKPIPSSVKRPAPDCEYIY